MRMNYRKRLWPILALLPVFALAAAALSFGLPGLSPPPPAAEAQALPTGNAVVLAMGTECSFTIANSGGADSYVFAATSQLQHGGPCITSANSLTVKVINADDDSSTGDEGPAHMLVYVTGGTDYPNIQAGGSSGYGKLGVNEVQLSVPSQQTTPFSSTAVNGERTITVTRSMAMAGDVYLLFYRAGSTGTPLGPTPTRTDLPDLPAGAGEYRIVKVEFTGDAVAKLAADSTMNASTLTVRGVGHDADADPPVTDSALSTTTGQREVQVTSDGEATVTLTLKDANGKPVNAQAEFVVGGADDIIFAGSLRKSSIRQGTATGVITETIQNLPRTGALRIPLTATVGDLELTYDIIRTGPEAAELSVTAYACTVVLDDQGDPVGDDDTSEDYCVDETEDLKGDTNTANDPDPLTVVAPGDHFLLVGNARDSVGNLSQADAFTLRWSAGDDTAAVLANPSTENVEFDPPGTDAMVGDLDTAVVRVASTASLGSYSLTVADKGGDVPEDGRATVNFIVSGGPDPEDGYSISGADNIALGQYEEYTVQVVDANDNPPNLDGSNRCIGIRVRGVGFNSEQDLISRVETSGDCNGLTRLDNAGQARFTIEAPLGITAGATASIQIRAYGRIVADKTITFGEAPLTLGNPAGLSVSSDAAGAATVTWTPAANATIHWVWRVKPDGMDGDWHRAAADAGTLTIEGLDSGADYYFIAIAGRTENNMTRWSQWTNWSARTTID